MTIMTVTKALAPGTHVVKCPDGGHCAPVNPLSKRIMPHPGVPGGQVMCSGSMRLAGPELNVRRGVLVRPNRTSLEYVVWDRRKRMPVAVLVGHQDALDGGYTMSEIETADVCGVSGPTEPPMDWQGSGGGDGDRIETALGVLKRKDLVKFTRLMAQSKALAYRLLSEPAS